jgi:hypothetical protein
MLHTGKVEIVKLSIPKLMLHTGKVEIVNIQNYIFYV